MGEHLSEWITWGSHFLEGAAVQFFYQFVKGNLWLAALPLDFCWFCGSDSSSLSWFNNYFLSFFLLTVHQCSRTLPFTWIMVNTGLVVQLCTKGSLTEQSLKRVSRKYIETCIKKLLALFQTKKHTPDSNSPGNAQYTVFIFVMKPIFM